MNDYHFKKLISGIEDFYVKHIDTMYDETGCIDEKNESFYKVCEERRLLITLIEYKNTTEVKEWFEDQIQKFNLQYTFDDVRRTLNYYDLSGNLLEIRMISDLNDLNQAILHYKYQEITKEQLQSTLKFYKDKIEQIEELLK